MSYSHGLSLVIHIIVQTCGILSVLGSGFIVLSFIVFGELLRTRQVRLVLFLAFSDFFKGVALALGDGKKLGVVGCYVQSVLITFFELSSVLWCCNIATGILVNIVKPSKRLLFFFEIYYQIFGWGIPLIVTSVFIIFGVNGHESDLGGWCWINDSKFTPTQKGFWQVAGFFVFLWISCLYIFLIFFVIGFYVCFKNKHLKKKVDKETYKAIRKQNHLLIFKFLFYPVILVICYFWANVNEFYSMVFGEDFVVFIILHSLFAHSLGFTNCIVYGFTQNVFSRYKNLFCRFCFCKRKRFKMLDDASTSSSKNIERGKEEGDKGDEGEFVELEDEEISEVFSLNGEGGRNIAAAFELDNDLSNNPIISSSLPPTSSLMMRKQRRISRSGSVVSSSSAVDDEDESRNSSEFRVEDNVELISDASSSSSYRNQNDDDYDVFI